MAIERRTSPRGEISYRVRLRFANGREVSSTHQRLTDARDWEARARTSLKSERSPHSFDAQRHTAQEAITRYLELLPSLGLRDERSRRRHAEWWAHELGTLPLARVTPTRVAEARDRLQTTPMRDQAPVAQGSAPRPPRFRGPATIVRYLATLSYIFTLAIEDWGWCDDNPVRKVRKPRQPRGRVRYLSDAERARLIAVCQGSSSTSLYPVVVLAIATGMRKSEILELRWSHVDLARGLITLHHTKNGERRQLPLVAHAAEMMTAWAAAAPHTDAAYVFPGVNPGAHLDITKAWNTALRHAGLVDFRFHDLRHTTASYLAQRGASILEIGEVLGHKSPQSTKRYSHLSVAHTRSVLTGMVEATFPPTVAEPATAPLAA